MNAANPREHRTERWTPPPAAGTVGPIVTDRDGIANAKARLRRVVLDALAGLAPDRRRADAVLVTRYLVGLVPVAGAGTILAFLSMPTEVDTWPMIRWAWRRGKRIAVPRILAAGANAAGSADVQRMEAVHLAPADVPRAADHPSVRPDAYGILTVPGAPAVPASAIDVVLVPSVAIDRRGNRLGRRGGYYDRFLAQPDLRAARIAPALGPQLVDRVPVEAHDVPVDRVVTPAGVLRFER